MNTDELKELVNTLPEDLKNSFSKKEFLNQKLNTKESIESFFVQSRSVAEAIQYLSKFNGTAQIEIKANIDYGYYEGEEEAQLEATVTEHRNETDDELTARILSKIDKIKTNKQKLK